MQQIDPMRAMSNAYTLKAMMQQGEAAAFQQEQARKAAQRDDALRAAFVVGQDGKIDRTATLRNLTTAGAGQQAAALSHQWQGEDLAMKKAESEAKTAMLTQHAKTREYVGPIFAAGGENPTPEWIAGAAKYAIGLGVLSQENLPQDPAQLQAWYQQQRRSFLSVEQQFEQERKANEYSDPLLKFMSERKRMEERERAGMPPAPMAPTGSPGPGDLQAPGVGVTARNGLDAREAQLTYGDPKPFRYDVNGNLVANPEVQKYEKTKASAGAPSVTVYPPGAIEPGKATRTDIEKDLRSTDARIARLTSIEQQFRPEFLNVSNRISGAWSSIKEKFGANLDQKDKAFLSEFSQFKQTSIEQLNQYINEITGAAVGATEAPRLISAMPNPGTNPFNGDSPTEFWSKLQGVTKQLKMAEARQVYALRNGMSVFNDKGEPLISLARMPQIMNERGKELERELARQNPKMQRKELQSLVTKALGREFGLATD